MGRYVRGRINETLALSTLAGETLISDIFDDVVNERSRISSIEIALAIQEYTKGAGIGPVMVGVAHSDYTDAEIEAVVENTSTWEEQDQIGQEIARRKVRILGIFETPDVASESTRLNDGRKLKVKLNWILDSGAGLRLWAYNLGSAAFATTSPLVTAVGHANLWYL